MELGVCLTTDVENPVVGDMLLSMGDSVTHTDRLAETRQRITVRLNFFLGEYFLNLNEGMPWLDVLGQKDAEADFRAALTTCIQETEGVATLLSLTVTEGERRAWTADFTAQLIDGTVASFGPFVVTIRK
jgi:hypothetical protein